MDTNIFYGYILYITKKIEMKKSLVIVIRLLGYFYIYVVSARKLNNFRHCEERSNLFALVVNSLRLPRFARNDAQSSFLTDTM